MNKYLLSILLLTLPGLLPVAQAGELGRLFNSPQERKQLEYQDNSSASTGSSGEVVRRNSIVVNGVVQKKGGKRTIWVNGTEQEAGLANDKTPATVPVTVPGKSKPVQLKVGERLLLDTTAPAEEEK